MTAIESVAPSEPVDDAVRSPPRSPGRPRAVWYAGGDSRRGELWTMLHPPYTLMVLSFVAVGSALAPHPALTTFVWSEAAYFLGLGVGAHLLDQVSGMGSRYVRHWSDRELWAGGLGALGAAIAIGAAGALLYFPRAFLLVVAVQAFFAAAYPLAPLFRGWFHRDGVFAFAWGAMPFLVTLYAQGGSLSVETGLVALAFAAVSLVEISLSRISRGVRAAIASLGSVPTGALDLQAVGRRAESALAGLAMGTYALALAWVASRFLPPWGAGL